MLDDWFLRIEVDTTRISPVLKQPKGALGVSRDRIAQQIRERTRRARAAQLVGCRAGPFDGFATFGGFCPQKIEPERRILAERGVVQRLRHKWISAACDQQAGKLFRHQMGVLPPFPAAYDADQRRERIAAIRPRGICIGAGIEQQTGNRQRILALGVDREARIGQSRKRFPAVELASVVGQRAPLRKEQAHRVDIMRRGSRVYAGARNLGVPAQQAGSKRTACGAIALVIAPLPRRGTGAVTIDRFLKEQVDVVLQGAGTVFHFLLQLGP